MGKEYTLYDAVFKRNILPFEQYLDGDCSEFDKTYGPVELLYRRQKALILPGQNGYGKIGLSFECGDRHCIISPAKTDDDLPFDPAVQDDIAEFFGPLVYEYKLRNPEDLLIYNYPLDAMSENVVSREFLSSNSQAHGYSIGFLDKNPNYLSRGRSLGSYTKANADESEFS